MSPFKPLPSPFSCPHWQTYPTSALPLPVVTWTLLPTLPSVEGSQGTKRSPKETTWDWIENERLFENRTKCLTHSDGVWRYPVSCQMSPQSVMLNWVHSCHQTICQAQQKNIFRVVSITIQMKIISRDKPVLLYHYVLLTHG